MSQSVVDLDLRASPQGAEERRGELRRPYGTRLFFPMFPRAEALRFVRPSGAVSRRLHSAKAPSNIHDWAGDTLLWALGQSARARYHIRIVPRLRTCFSL